MTRVPQVGERTMSTPDISAGLRRLKKMGVPATQIAKMLGKEYSNFTSEMTQARFQLQSRVKLTWLIRMIEGGFLKWVKTGRGEGAFLPTEFAMHDAFVAKQLSRCTCGKYHVCPCGCFKPESMEECLYSLSDAAMPNAVVSMMRQNPNPAALVAGLREGNGSPSASQSGKTKPPKPTKT